MAKEEEAAIGLSGRVRRKGLVPSPGPETSMVEGTDDRRGARSGVAGGLLAARLGGAVLSGVIVLGETVGEELGLGFGVGGAFRASREVVLLGATADADGLTADGGGLPGVSAVFVCGGEEIDGVTSLG